MKTTKAQRELLEDIVGGVELAAALNISRGLLSVWQQRHADFPAPVLTLAAGRFYRLSEVLAWHAARQP